MPEDSGFTLLEALVALAILAIAISGIVGVFASSYGNVEKSLSRFRAMIEARSLLERVGLDIPNTVQASDGVLADGALWHLSIQPYRADAEALPGLHQVIVRVEPAGSLGGPVELTSLLPTMAPR